MVNAAPWCSINECKLSLAIYTFKVKKFSRKSCIHENILPWIFYQWNIFCYKISKLRYIPYGGNFWPAKLWWIPACWLSLCYETLLKFVPVLHQICQGFPPPKIHTIWYALVQVTCINLYFFNWHTYIHNSPYYVLWSILLHALSLCGRITYTHTWIHHGRLPW